MRLLIHSIKKSTEIIKNRLLCVALSITMLVIIIMIGVVISPTGGLNSYIKSGVERYVEGLFLGKIGSFFAKTLLYLILFSFLGYICFLFPCLQVFLWLFLCYKGFIIGQFIRLLFTFYKVNALLISFFYFLLSFLEWFGILCYCICLFDGIGVSFKCKSYLIREQLHCFYILFCYRIVLFLLEIFFVLFFFRLIFHLF